MYNDIKKFIFNDEVQGILSEINSNLMDFNILEITGMGNQEIKHSNILGWLFDNSEHNLDHIILDDFLKKVINENRQYEVNNPILDDLQSYLYLSNNKRDITIYREKDNIDLLIVDESNKIVITIENKVFASERKNGNDGGQLQKYEKIINDKYNDEYEKYFIFLTINLEEPSKDNWLRANHQMITDVIENILKTKEITIKTKIVLESYVDLLKRNGIVADNKLEELASKIWDNPKYKNALDVLYEYKPDISMEISKYLQKVIEKYTTRLLILKADSSKTYIRFYDKTWENEKKGNQTWTKDNKVLLYEIKNRTDENLKLVLLIGPSKYEKFRTELFTALNKNPKKSLSDKFCTVWKLDILSKTEIQEKSIEDIKNIIDKKLNDFFKEFDGDFYKIREKLEPIMGKFI